MWRQYAVDCAKDRRMTPTVADAMFARVDNSSASSALGAIFITDRQWRLAVERRGSRRARRRKKRSIFSKRVRVPAFHRNGQTPIKGSTLTSLITGTDEASRRGADTGERRDSPSYVRRNRARSVHWPAYRRKLAATLVAAVTSRT